jgi:hypothetical protein
MLIVALLATSAFLALGRGVVNDGRGGQSVNLAVRIADDLGFLHLHLPTRGVVSPTPTLSTCDFQIGDVIQRGAVGAVVPPLGRWVAGFGFLANPTPGSDSDIRIATSMTGVVVIEPPGSRCQLAPTAARLSDPR